MVCAMRSFENVNKGNIEWLQSVGCELGIRNMTGTYIVSAVMKQNEGVGKKNESEEGESSECINHSMVLHCI
jgi:hypothetical protein